MKDVFTKIHQDNFWGSDESVSGTGSTLAATDAIRKRLPGLFNELQIKTLLDIPCGDFNWFKEMPSNLEMYIGADIVPDIIATNIDAYDHKRREFLLLDITKDELPKADMILVRDLLGHFSNPDLQRALRNIKRSGAKYLLATTFPDYFNLFDIETGQWRELNLAYYCGLPQPIELIEEDQAGKYLGLWRLR